MRSFANYSYEYTSRVQVSKGIGCKQETTSTAEATEQVVCILDAIHEKADLQAVVSTAVLTYVMQIKASYRISAHITALRYIKKLLMM